MKLNLRKLLTWVLVLILMSASVSVIAEDLATLMLPATLNIIEEEAFYGDTSINKVIVPEGTKEIRSRAFADSSLTEIEFPDSLDFIADDALDGCADVKVTAAEDSYAYGWAMQNGLIEASPVEDFEYTIEDGTVTITMYNGYDDNVVVPAMIEGYPVKTIGDGTESIDIYCDRIYLPENVETIAPYAFGNCSVSEIYLPNSLTAIEEKAFEYCSGLWTVDIPQNVKRIAENAFLYCDELENIFVSDQNAYYADDDGILFNRDYTSLIYYPDIKKAASYTIPESVTSIASTAFCGCGIEGLSYLEEILVAKGNTSFASVDGVLFTRDMKTLLQFPANKDIQNYTVPVGTEIISDFAFINNCYVYSVILPDGVTTIGAGAFMDCQMLSHIYIPESVHIIDEDAFDYYSDITIHGVSGSYAEEYANEYGFDFCEEGITESYVTPAEDFEYIIENGECTIKYYYGSRPLVVIPEEIEGCPVTTLHDGPFNECFGVRKVIVPATVTEMPSISYYCFTIQHIQVDENNPAYTSVNGIVYTKDMESIVAFPGSSMESPEGALDGVKYICESAFDCCQFTSINIPDSVVSIGAAAFSFCSLEELRIPDSVTTIGPSAFAACEQLKSVELGSGITRIEEYTFGECYELKSINIPEGVEFIGTYAFRWCNNLKNFVLPESLECIDPYAFVDCDVMTSVTVPQNVNSIGDAPFVNCNSLTEILVAEENDNYISVDGVLFTKDMLELVCYPAGKANAEYVIPDGVEEMSDDAFGYNTLIEKVTIPGSMVSISEFAFVDCEALKEVIIREGVTNIERYAFQYCESLEYIDIPASVMAIGEKAFQDCSSELTICSESGSYAETYANENGIAFSVLSNPA